MSTWMAVSAWRRSSTWLRARESGFRPRTSRGFRPFVQVGEGCKSLVEYLKAFDVTLSVMQTYDSLVRTAF